MIYGYVRVSTRGQMKEGYSLEAQEKEIVDRYEGVMIKREQYTGATTDRPILKILMKVLRHGDTLVVTKLDRLARNTIEGIQIVQDLFDRGVKVHVLNLGLLEDTSMGKFFLTTLLAVAEMERSTIVERTQSGKAIAKAKGGYMEGRPCKFTQTQIDMALDLLIEHSYTKVEEMTRISKSTLTREMRKRKEKQIKC